MILSRGLYAKRHGCKMPRRTAPEEVSSYTQTSIHTTWRTRKTRESRSPNSTSQDASRFRHRLCCRPRRPRQGQNRTQRLANYYSDPNWYVHYYQDVRVNTQQITMGGQFQDMTGILAVHDNSQNLIETKTLPGGPGVANYLVPPNVLSVALVGWNGRSKTDGEGLFRWGLSLDPKNCGYPYVGQVLGAYYCWSRLNEEFACLRYCPKPFNSGECTAMGGL
jgi:hypothetical protein